MNRPITMSAERDLDKVLGQLQTTTREYYELSEGVVNLVRERDASKQTIAELREQLESCNWCKVGIPVSGTGNHIIKGYYGSGDGAIPCPRFAVRQRDELRSQLQQATASYRDLEPCGHTKNFLIGDEHGHFTCTVCQLREAEDLRKTFVATINTAGDFLKRVLDEHASEVQHERATSDRLAAALKLHTCTSGGCKIQSCIDERDALAQHAALRSGTDIKEINKHEDERTKKIQNIIDLYFMLWGDAKAAMWEELVGDGPFNDVVALNLIRDVLRSEPVKVKA